MFEQVEAKLNNLTQDTFSEYFQRFVVDTEDRNIDKEVASAMSTGKCSTLQLNHLIDTLYKELVKE